jgi:hypothetical protein
MPFTPTHTLAALPIAWLWSRHGTFSALVIGTMVPDWPLYVPIGPVYQLTHSLRGLFTACLPIGFALAILYHLGLKQALFQLLPAGLRARLSPYVDVPSILRPATLLAIAAAVLIGAASHIVWDAFTHYGAWGVRLVPMLSDTLFRAGNLDIPIYMALQHGCTLVGFPVFLLAVYVWYRRTDAGLVPAPVLSPWVTLAWRAAFVAIPAGSMFQTVLGIAPFFPSRDAIYLLIHGVTRTGFIILVLLACYGLFFALAGRDDRAAARQLQPDESGPLR